jgi:arylsulfatase A-like enzyme
VVGSLGLVVAALAAIAPGPRKARASRPPGIVLVSIDTLRPDHVGCYGYRRPTTPQIDRFRRDAVLFRQAVAQAPSTLASHASLFTSLRPPHHGASVSANTKLRPGIVTLAGALKKAGFATASFNGGGQLHRSWGLDRGFDVYVSATDSSDADVGDDTLADEVGRGTAWLDGVGDRPFFLFLHTYEVHHPYTPDPRRLRALDPGYAGSLPDRISIRLLEKINSGQRHLGKGDLGHIEAAYDAEIESADAAFGALVRWLRAKGLYDDALVVLTSDHGEAFGERGPVGWHGDALYDEQIRIPLVVKLPHAQAAGSTIENQVRAIDVAPTMLSRLGLAVPAGWSGVPIDIEGGAAGHPPWAMAALDGNERSLAIRTSRWKWYDGRLYDLEKDPRETRDVERRRPDVERELQDQIVAFVRSRGLAPPTPAEVPEGVEEQLHALGYLPSRDR